MKKVFLLLMAFAAATASFAQANLALNKTAKASSVSDENNVLTADKAVDGDTNSKWASNYDTKNALGWDDSQKSAQWFYVDLGAEYDVNTVKISWDNQAAHKFDIRYSTAAPVSDDAVKTTGTAILTAQSGADWSTDTYQFDAVKARYIIVDLQERGPWGYGITELEVYNIDYDSSVLTSLTVAPTFFKAGEATAFTLSPIDNYNNVKEDVAFTVNGAAFENPFTAPVGGTFTITGTDATGHEASATVYGLEASQAPQTPEDVVLLYGADTSNEWYADWNGGAKADNEFTLGTLPVKSFNDTRCVFVANPALNAWDADVNPTAMGYASIHFSIYAPTDGTKVTIAFERTKTIGDNHVFTLNAGWNDVEVPLGGETLIHTVAVKNANQSSSEEGASLAIANIYYTKAESNPEAGKIVTLDVTPQLVASGVATPITLMPKDNLGADIDEGVGYEAEGLDNGVLTAQTGEVVITGSTNGGTETATATVYALAAPTRTNTADDIELLQSGRSTSGQGTDWDGGYTPLENLTYSDGTQAYHAKGIRKFYLTNPGLAADDLQGFTKLHLDIFSNIDKQGVVVNLEGINASTTIDVKAGQWTSVDVPFEGGKAATSWIWVKMAEPAEAATAEIVVDNIYFSKEEVPATLVIGTPNAKGTVAVSGKITAENKSEIEAINAPAIDLTATTSDEESITLSFENPNTILIVPADVTGDNPNFTFTPTLRLTNETNLVAKGGNWYFAVKPLVITDINEFQPWNESVNTRNEGYTIRRTLGSGHYATAYFPTTLTAGQALEDVTVYELADGTTPSEVVFAKRADGIVQGGTPYVLHATADVTIELKGKNDFNTAEPVNSKTVGGVVMQGNLQAREGSGYGLQGATGEVPALRPIATSATIGAFRAFFTGVEANATAKFADGEEGEGHATAISSLENDAETSAAFNLAGQRVARHFKGIVVKDGKKIIVR